MRWEYKTLKLEAGFRGGNLNPEELDQILNELDREGWEVVTSFDANQGNGETRDIIFILKRQQAVTKRCEQVDVYENFLILEDLTSAHVELKQSA
jgi:hypothetical protein